MSALSVCMPHAYLYINVLTFMHARTCFGRRVLSHSLGIVRLTLFANFCYAFVPVARTGVSRFAHVANMLFQLLLLLVQQCKILHQRVV